MNINEHTTPDKLERYSFLWSELGLCISALALFLGGVPPVLYIIRVPTFYGLISSLLTLAWIISGVASVYLLYRWNKNRTLFGQKAERDMYAFIVMIVSGINLGLAGIFSTNLGMSLSSNKLMFIIIGIIYLISAYHLHNRWKASGEKIF